MLYWECGELYACELYPSGGPWDLEYRDRGIFTANQLPHGVELPDDGRFNKHVYTAMLASNRLNGERDQLDQTIPAEFLYVWASIVMQYSERDLTYDRDKLVAIDGVAQQLAVMVPKEQYVAGLWRRPNLAIYLLWIARGERTRNRSAPSWSWAS
jgi:hypothetical protein